MEYILASFYKPYARVKLFCSSNFLVSLQIGGGGGGGEEEWQWLDLNAIDSLSNSPMLRSECILDLQVHELGLIQ